MRRILVIIALVFLFFLLESLFFHGLGRFLRPNLLLLLVIFFNFYFGIRYGLFSAFWAGILKDSISTHPFGMNLFAFVLCVYIAVFLKRYFFHLSISSFRLLLICLMVWIYNMAYFLFGLIFVPMQINEMFGSIFVPELASTLIITPFVLDQLKRCALKLFV